MTTNHTFVFTLFWTVTFCLGWRIVTNEGQLLHWIRKPFENIGNKLELYQDKLKLNIQQNGINFRLSEQKYYSQLIIWCKFVIFIGKPFVLCITCMASVWGATVFILLNGFSNDLIVPLILNSFSAAFIQTFIWSLYARYIQ